jgi:hypothetical protein
MYRHAWVHQSSPEKGFPPRASCPALERFDRAETAGADRKTMCIALRLREPHASGEGHMTGAYPGGTVDRPMVMRNAPAGTGTPCQASVAVFTVTLRPASGPGLWLPSPKGCRPSASAVVELRHRSLPRWMHGPSPHIGSARSWSHQAADPSHHLRLRNHATSQWPTAETRIPALLMKANSSARINNQFQSVNGNHT